MIRISVIVPHKDSPDLVNNLVETIPESEEIEVIIVDDHSSVPIGNSLNHRKNVKVISNLDWRKGPGAARNTGMEEAVGEWILFADSDDLFVENAFESVWRHIDDEFDVVYFKPTASHENSELSANRHEGYADLVDGFKNGDQKWIRFRFHVVYSKLIRRSLIIDNDIWFGDTFVGEDVLFSLKLGIHARIIEADDSVIYCITQGNSGSLSAQGGVDKLYDRFKAQSEYNDLLRSHGLWKYRITMLPVLRRAWQLGLGTFAKFYWLCIMYRQPLYDNWGHLYQLWKRRDGAK